MDRYRERIYIVHTYYIIIIIIIIITITTIIERIVQYYSTYTL